MARPYRVMLAVLLLAGCAHQPRLVGYDCVGAGGPLYADEEDHFPICKRIEKN